MLDGQLDAFLRQPFKLLAAFHGLTQLFCVWAGHSFRVVFAFLPDLILKIGPQRMVRVDARTIFSLERAMLHLINLCHLLEEGLSLFEEFAHGDSIV